MKVGDLVKMKYAMWWNWRPGSDYAPPGIVITRSYNALTLLYPDGEIRRDLAKRYEVISES